MGYYLRDCSTTFYFTNEQLAKVLDCSVSSAEKVMASLSKKKLIKSTYKVKAGGGRIRFVKNMLVNQPYSEPQKTATLSSRKLTGKENKTKENKNDNDKGVSETNTTSVSVVGDKKPISHDVEIAIAYYFDVYERHTGKQHPRLKAEQLIRIENTLDWFYDVYVDGYDRPSDVLRFMVDKWFERDNEKTDYNINHFANETILMNRYYDYCHFKQIQPW